MPDCDLRVLGVEELNKDSQVAKNDHETLQKQAGSGGWETRTTFQVTVNSESVVFLARNKGQADCSRKASFTRSFVEGVDWKCTHLEGDDPPVQGEVDTCRHE